MSRSQPSGTGLRVSSLICTPGLFRLLLASVVVVDHFTPIQLGSSAVYLFFMLSGFWVTKLWHNEYAPTAFPYRTFLISRLWRLLPVYYISLLTLLGINYAFHTSDRIWVEATTGSNAVHFCLSQLFILGYATLPLSAKLNNPVWSLDIELQFYIVAPLLIALLSKGSACSILRPALYAVALAGLAILVAFYGTISQSAFLPMYLSFFLIGLSTALRFWQPSERLAIGGVAVAVSLIVACAMLQATRPLLIYGKIHGSLSDYNTAANILLALLCAAYAMATVQRTGVKGTTLARLDRDLGNLSYEIYLLHVGALSLVLRLAGNLSGQARAPIIIVAWFALLVVSIVVYRCVDKPLDRRRHAWVRARPMVGLTTRASGPSTASSSPYEAGNA